MTTFDNAPPPADWTPQPGNTCTNCGNTSNYCRVIDEVDHGRCCQDCRDCTHCLPLTWAGDDN